jgi:hypothetical protein
MDSMPDNDTVVAKFDGCNQGYKLALVDDNVTGILGTGDPSTTRTVTSSSGLWRDWDHIALVYDDVADELRVYINGELRGVDSEATADPAPSGTDLFIGSNDDLQGNVDEVRIWSKALTDEEIRESYELYRVDAWKEFDWIEIRGEVWGEGDCGRRWWDLSMYQEDIDRYVVSVPMYEDVRFMVNGTLWNWSNSTLCCLEGKDRLAADLELGGCGAWASLGEVYVYEQTGKGSGKGGKSEKLFIDWDFEGECLPSQWDNGPGDDWYASMWVDVSTDVNPGQQKPKDKGMSGINEYTSEGLHEINSGLTVKFCTEIAGEVIPGLSITSRPLEVYADPDWEEPLWVSAYAEPMEAYAGDPVDFFAEAGGGTPPYSYEWNFYSYATPTTSTEQNPTVTYAERGIDYWKYARLRVEDDDGTTHYCYIYDIHILTVPE